MSSLDYPYLGSYNYLGTYPVTNDQYYNLLSTDPSPLTLTDAKAFMRITSTTDDVLIQSLIDACTEFGESHTCRSFRIQAWELFVDCFTSPIVIRRNPVTSITSIEYLVDDAFTTVSTDVYYLKSKTQTSEILLADGQSWPTDIDNREQAIKITFATGPFWRTETILNALKRHVLWMYENRGDCGECDCADGARASGVISVYSSGVRIPRI